MTDFLNLELPVSSADCAEIEAIFIDLLCEWNGAAPIKAVHPALPFVEPPSSA